MLFVIDFVLIFYLFYLSNLVCSDLISFLFLFFDLSNFRIVSNLAGVCEKEISPTTLICFILFYMLSYDVFTTSYLLFTI